MCVFVNNSLVHLHKFILRILSDIYALFDLFLFPKYIKTSFNENLFVTK